MTAFFMLSGFSLFVNYEKADITNAAELKSFWLKRIINVIPMYYIIALLYIIKHWNTDAIIQNALLLPIEALCIQSNFSSLFGFTHNGGTWFVSCIMMCYLVYPLLQNVAKSISLKTKIATICICSFLLLYSPLITRHFAISGIYSNTFFRILEFTIGVMLAALKSNADKSSFVKKYLYNWVFILLVNFVLLAGITCAVKLGICVGDYMLYSWIGLPCFIFLLLSLSGVKSHVLEKSKLLKYFSALSYSFFLAQLFSNGICKRIMTKYSITNNLAIILLGWGVCIIIAFLFHELLEKPITRFLRKKTKKWLDGSRQADG